MGVRDEAVEKTDAGRVAPLVLAFLQTPNAISNGGDASRVGAFFNSFVSRRFFSSLVPQG